MRNTFTVYERLKKEQHIDTLFRTGKAFSVFPLRFIYNVVTRLADDASPVLAGFSVPKKKFARSVDRHRTRRLMVEAWRTNKSTIYDAVPAGCQLHLFLIFTGNEIPSYETVRAAVVAGSEKLARTLKPKE